MAQEQKESIDRTFDQFMQPDLGFRTGVDGSLDHIQSELLWVATDLEAQAGELGEDVGLDGVPASPAAAVCWAASWPPPAPG